ncbi:MAG TPA: sulfatase, partial [Polyangiales bacterium]
MGGSTWTARLAMLGALCGIQCGSGERALIDPSLSAEVEPAFGDRPNAVPADQPGVSNVYEAQLNLQNLVHLADIDHHGLFIDFGTPARAKYTASVWQSGWGSDGVDGDTTFTRVGANGLVVVPLSGSQPFTLRVRLRTFGAQTLEAFIDDEALTAIELDKADVFAEYDIEVPAGRGHAGENQLRLRFGTTRRIGDEDVAAELDSIRIIPPVLAADGGVVPESFSAAFEALPIYGALIQLLAVDGHKRRAITVSAPTTLSYHLQVPPGALLSLRVGSPDGKAGSARALVKITPEGGPTKLLWQQVLTGQWAEPLLTLDRWAGSVVKLELSGLGQGVIGFASPAILVPRTIARSRPVESVVLLAVDDLRPDHLHAYNPNTPVIAPAFDAFASDAIIFENAQSTDGSTEPAIASLLTGSYPSSHGVQADDVRLGDDALLISEAFKQAGFTTAAFSADGYGSEQFGFDQGWDRYHDYSDAEHGDAATLFRAAGDWIASHQHERFFVYLETIDALPYDPPPAIGKSSLDDRDRQQLEGRYDAAISSHDRAFGQFIERLKKLGLYDRIAFVVSSDHGVSLGDHGSFGAGRSSYQMLLHVPFVARLPTRPARRVADTVSIVDVAPTLLAAAGVPRPAAMEGTDLTAQTRGGASMRPPVAFSDIAGDRRVITAGRWKLILRGPSASLFDLQTDPEELHELDQASHP